MNKIKLILSFLLISVFIVEAQDIDYARKIVSELASEKYSGRGIANDGMNKAGDFLIQEFKIIGITAIDEKYSQSFSFPVNTITKCELSVNNNDVIAGVDYMIDPDAPKCRIKAKYVTLKPNKIRRDAKLLENLDKMVLVCKQGQEKIIRELPKIPKALIIIDDAEKLSWHQSRTMPVSPIPVIHVKKGIITEEEGTVKIKIDNKEFPDFTTKNVYGIIEGKTKKDSFICITAHYDHLGMMGEEAVFPGANDNASGVALMLNIAKHFVENPPEFSVVFIAFAAEEYGLVGSFAFADKPVIDLKNIRFLINLDMIGNGSEGITVTNSSEYPQEYALMQKINEEKKLLAEVKKRSVACNSDHCPFYEKGVPSVFIYTRGKEYQEYHNIYDKSEGLPFTVYNELFVLLTDFIEKL